MSQVWHLKTVFTGREEFRLLHYHSKKMQFPIITPQNTDSTSEGRCDCSTESWALSLAFTVLACWEGNFMALLEFAPCFREVRHSWGYSSWGSPWVSSRGSTHTSPTPGPHGDREVAQVKERNQETELLNFFGEEDSLSFCNKIP